MEPCVLLIDDQAGDVDWLVDLISSRGYSVDLATHEEAGRERLLAMKQGKVRYELAIIDVMVAVKDLMALEKLGEEFFLDSKDSGIRLCRYARDELGLTKDRLPIACHSVRDDRDLLESLKPLDVEHFARIPENPSEGIRRFVQERLPLLDEGPGDTAPDTQAHANVGAQADEPEAVETPEEKVSQSIGGES